MAQVPAGGVEVSVHGGLNRFSNSNGSQKKSVVGVGAAYHAGRFLSLGGEWSYLPLASESGSYYRANESLQQFNGVMRARFLPAHQVDPYFTLAGGFSRDHAHASATICSFSCGSYTADGTQKGGNLGAGLGADFAFGRLGVRPEFRYVRDQFHSATIQGSYFNGYGVNSLRLTGAVFYTFGGSTGARGHHHRH